MLMVPAVLALMVLASFLLSLLNPPERDRR